MPNARRRVHVKFYYDTTQEKVDARPDYKESIKASLLNAILQHTDETFMRRIKKVEVRISRPHKACHCPTEKCKCR